MNELLTPPEVMTITIAMVEAAESDPKALDRIWSTLDDNSRMAVACILSAHVADILRVIAQSSGHPFSEALEVFRKGRMDMAWNFRNEEES